LKFIPNFNENPEKRYQKQELSPTIKIIKIIEAQENQETKKNSLPEIQSSKKMFDSSDNEFRNKENFDISKPGSPSVSPKPWKSHKFKNIIFNPNSSAEVFYDHLIMTYKGLIYAKEFLEEPDQSFLKNKNVKFLWTGNLL